MIHMRSLVSTAFAALAIFLSTVAQASVISAGTPTTTAPDYLTDGTYLPGISVPPLGLGTFLLPVEITGAINLELTPWQFDLSYNPLVVRALDPMDGSGGIYGARFIPTDPDSLSFVLSGLQTPADGLLSIAAGSYPSFFTGSLSGDGTLAYILFEYMPGQEVLGDPKFSIVGSTPPQPVPEPGVISLAALALAILFLSRGRKAAVSRPASNA